MIRRMSSATQSDHKDSAPVSLEGFYVKAGLCLGCCRTQEEAPDLIECESTGLASATCGQRCRFKRQPETPDQLLRAIKATHVSCSRAIRYGGNDARVLDLLADYGLHSQCDRFNGSPSDLVPLPTTAAHGTHSAIARVLNRLFRSIRPGNPRSGARRP
jgi:hypothetical protein